MLARAYGAAWVQLVTLFAPPAAPPTHQLAAGLFKSQEASSSLLPVPVAQPVLLLLAAAWLVW